jgi:prepilin-type N-terminal cleavage/methylation domain-containing protein
MAIFARSNHGFTLIELLFVVSLITVLLGIAVPISGDAIDDMRTGAAARYLAGRITNSRLEAINRSRAVGLQFLASTTDYQFAPYVDGNGNGVRTADIHAGLDSPAGTPRQIGDDFRGVRFRLGAGVPDVDGLRTTTTDGVRIGTARILTMSPDGTATSGTLYLQGRNAQYAVRVLGATGRTRVLKYEAGERTWISR